MELSGVLNGFFSQFREREKTAARTTTTSETRTRESISPHISDLFNHAIKAYDSTETSSSLATLFFAYGAFRLLQRQNEAFLQNFAYGDISIADIVTKRIESFQEDLQHWEKEKWSAYSYYSDDLLDFLADVVHSRIGLQTLQEVSREADPKNSRIERESMQSYLRTVFPLEVTKEKDRDIKKSLEKTRVDTTEVEKIERSAAAGEDQDTTLTEEEKNKIVINCQYIGKNTRTTRRDIIGIEKAMRTSQYMDLETLVMNWQNFKVLTREWERELYFNSELQKTGRSFQKTQELRRAA